MDDNLNAEIAVIDTEYSVDWQENIASKKILPDIQEHLDYLVKVYNFCFDIQSILDKKTYGEVGSELMAQMIILMRITDFLRNILFAIIRGYPDQAGTLGSSIFELAHTSAYFLHNPEAAIKWLASDGANENMPNLIGVSSYKQLVEYNYALKNMESNSHLEYKVYRQLCWMKYSHPAMQDVALVDAKFQFLIGPHTDERSIKHAWFSIYHSGRLAELTIGNLCTLSDMEVVQTKLEMLAKIRDDLDKKTVARFGSIDLFK